MDLNFFASVDSVMQGLIEQQYIATRSVCTTVFLSGRLEKPLLVEGPAGVGKTGLAGAIAGAMDAQLVRLQCYPGLDESKTLYEWNYHKQLLYVQMYGSEHNLFTEEFLLERPLLKAFRAKKPVVLLVDEIDKGEDELESFLLEAFSEFQVTIPEYGTVRAERRPYVIITSNGTRELSDAMKRRCLYLYLDYPDAELEEAIITLKVPGLGGSLVRDIVNFVQRLREMKLKKAPSINESIDWARTLLLLGHDEISEELARETLNVLLKYEDDIKKVNEQVAKLIPARDEGAEETLTGKGGMQVYQPSAAHETDLSRFNF